MTEPLIEAAKCIETAEDLLSSAFRKLDKDSDAGEYAVVALAYATLATAYHGQIASEGTITLRQDAKAALAEQSDFIQRAKKILPEDDEP